MEVKKTIYFITHIHAILIEVVCEPSCVNGTCIFDGVCQCFSGWTGPICNQGINEHYINNNREYQINHAYNMRHFNYVIITITLISVQCVPTCAHGSCVGPNTCQCDPGWTGRSCRIG